MEFQDRNVAHCSSYGPVGVARRKSCQPRCRALTSQEIGNEVDNTASQLASQPASQLAS